MEPIHALTRSDLVLIGSQISEQLLQKHICQIDPSDRFTAIPPLYKSNVCGLVVDETLSQLDR